MLATLIMVLFVLFLAGLLLTFMGFASGLTNLLFPPPPPSNRMKDIEETIRKAEETLREIKEYENRRY